MSEKKQAGRSPRAGQRKRPDVSFNFGANARPRKKKGGLASKYAAGGS
jgi:hypothetical protein